MIMAGLSVYLDRMLREMRCCCRRDQGACRALAYLPLEALQAARRGVLSDQTITALAAPAHVVEACEWRRDCGCRVSGLFADLVLVGAGELRSGAAYSRSAGRTKA